MSQKYLSLMKHLFWQHEQDKATTHALAMPCSSWAELLIGLHPTCMTAHERRLLRLHLAHCRDCKRVFEDYRTLDERTHHALSRPPLRWPVP